MPITQILLTATTAQGGGGGTYPTPGSGSYNVSAGTMGVSGTPYDPGGGVESVSNSQNGWAYYIKDGRFNSDTTFFNGVARTGTDIYGGFGYQNLPKEEYAFQWVGYLPAPSTGTYNIALESDDLLYFWIGTNALEGNYNFSNYHHSTNNNIQFAQHSLSLTGGLYYPVRMWFQEWSGAEQAQVYFGQANQLSVAMNQFTIANNSLTEGHNLPPATAVMSLIASDYSGSGTSWADSSGNNSTGTLVNSPTYQGATIPKYFTFDRQTQQFVQGVSVGDLSTWTIESWFRVEEPLSNTQATALITTTYSTDVTNYGVINYTLSNFAEAGGNSNLTVGFFASNTWYTTAGFIPTVGVWYHVVGTYDGTTIKQWVDGTLLGTTRTITATTTANGGPVRIARRWDGLPTDAAQFFTGDIAVAKIYDGVLTDEEIVAAYEATSATYPNYTLTPAANNVNEGSSLEFTVSGNRITDGTYYWTIDSNSVDFGTASGSFSITNNSGTFSVTPSADATTEGEQIFDVEVRSGAVDGPVLVSSGNIIINDTSLTKLQLTSGEALGFNGVDNRHVIVADNLADWDLGDNWTIEWWHKIPVGVDGFLSVLCQDANVPTYSGIDVFVNAGNICMFNGNLSFAEAAATRDEWNHIAIQKNGTSLAAYINGVAQTLGGSHPGTIAPSSPLNVCIGSRTYDGGANFYGQYFNGQLANIRISSIARYTGTFTPPTTVEYDVNTKLALDGSVGGGGMLVDELTRHTLTNNGATIDTID